MTKLNPSGTHVECKIKILTTITRYAALKAARIERHQSVQKERKKLKTQRFKIKKKAIIERRTSYAEVMKTWRSHKIPAG